MTGETHGDEPRPAGWQSDFPTFHRTGARVIQISLEEFLGHASEQQDVAWERSIPLLQDEVREIDSRDPRSPRYTAILECRLPLDSRRPDAIFLVAGAVVVIELKGKALPTQADLDQAAAYARDLRAYHRECQDRPVHAVLLPTGSKDVPREVDGVWVTGPEALDRLVLDLTRAETAAAPTAEAFLDVAAYSPLPTLVEAARDLFEHHRIREVWRARARTEPAVERVAAIAEEAARTRTRRLVLLTGVPGSGKTLVGLRAVHAGYLDSLAVGRQGGKPTVPALFLSGNGPLVQVLQHVLRGAGGGGRTFVRHIKDYLDAYVPRAAKVPPEHLLVFDEAQRAFSADQVRQKHPRWPEAIVQSEPAHFVEVCGRMPEWAVLIGLIGEGQEIHLGEEGGLAQWRDAILGCPEPGAWSVHAPANVEAVFAGSGLPTTWEPTLNLDTGLRYHLAQDLHLFVAELLEPKPQPGGASIVADRLWRPRGHAVEGLRLWATRDLEVAKAYLRSRYDGQPDARYGLLASSRDKHLPAYGVDNTWQTTKRIALGPWFSEGEESPASCRHFASCVTEFGVQGLELEMALVAWGTDYRRHGGRWSDDLARRYRPQGVRLVNPFQLRQNAYRVLLTRGRDGTVVFVPPLDLLDETWAYLLESGFRDLGAAPADGDAT